MLPIMFALRSIMFPFRIKAIIVFSGIRLNANSPLVLSSIGKSVRDIISSAARNKQVFIVSLYWVMFFVCICFFSCIDMYPNIHTNIRNMFNLNSVTNFLSPLLGLYPI